MSKIFGISALATAIIACGAAASVAQEFRIGRATTPSPFLTKDGAIDEKIEASGVEPIGDGKLLLVVHDKVPQLYVVDRDTGREVALLSSDVFPEGARRDPKWEGLALDSQGNYYVIGAHSGNSQAQRDGRAFLCRFRLKPGSSSADAPTIDAKTVRNWKVRDGLSKGLRENGVAEQEVAKLKIEGLTIRESENQGKRKIELVIGLRLPSDKVRAFAADISDDPVAESELATKLLFSFDPGAREGVRGQQTSLEYSPIAKGFFVVSATEDDNNAFHGNTLWFVADDRLQGDPKDVAARSLGVLEVAQKAEGFCILPTNGQAGANVLDAIITYDNDPHATHIPSRMSRVRIRLNAQAGR